MPARPRHVLFLCTGNSARSILAEGLLRRHGAGRFRAYSAGSRPTGKVHPEALACLARHGHAIEAFHSKSWDAFALPEAAPLDFVFTVCGHAAGEACPVWPGAPQRAHWGVEDPAACTGDPARQREAFEDAYARLARRVRRFVGLSLDALAPDALARELAAIGEL